MNWYINYYTLSLYFLIFTSQFAQVPFIGNMKLGFSFSLLPILKVDYLNQQIFVCSKEHIIQNNNQLSFSISVCDMKNNSLSSSYRFIPIITKNATVNGILEANPLYETGFNNFNLLLGLEFEPKFYPIVNPVNNSQIYIINNLELYNNQQNKLIATEPLLDINSNEGNIISLDSLQNKFIAGVMEKNTIFGGNNSFCQFYQYQIKEKVIQIPGSSNYITMLQISNPNIFSFSNENPSLCTINESQVTLFDNYITIHTNQTLNKAYIGVSGKGTTGIKAVTMYDEPILLSNNENALNGNNIVATNIPNNDLYINKITSLFTSTGLSYLAVLGGTNTPKTSISTIYALPLINSSDNINLIGTLANINQNPTPLFDMNNLHHFLGNTLTESPQNQGDLYTINSKEALVGNIPLIINNGINDYQLQINDIEGYKDTIFIATSYVNNDGKGVGGIFYSQALFNEYGMIKAWSKWQRKNISGNCQTQAYIPTIGSNIAIYSGINNQIFGTQFSSSGPFLSNSNKTYGLLNCVNSGIEKIIDIPHTHPGIGININPIIGLKPSYLIAVGYNTVILQQTAKNDFLLPIINGNIINCTNGNASNIIEKNIETNIITFQGGVLEKSNALFTAALGYSDIDAWLIVGGSNGIYILANSDGTGCGPTLLQDNFIGIKPTLRWQELGNFKTIKKIVSNKDFLYVVSNNAIYRIPLNAKNISLKSNCKYTILLKSIDLPRATEFSSFSDGIFSNNSCMLATSVGLFTNNINSSIKIGDNIPLEEIVLPESFGVMPIALYPITIDGNLDSWGNGENTDITGNIYLMATSLSQHYSKIYRFIAYGNNTTNKKTIFLLSNYFIKNLPTYYYNPNIELLSIATDGASIFSHGIYGNSIVYRSFIGILNPFIRHGNIALKNEYNFFELASKTNSYFGYPTYISGTGIWLFSGQNGIQGLC